MRVSKKVLLIAILVVLGVSLLFLFKKPNLAPQTNPSNPSPSQSGLNQEKVNQYISQSYPGYTITGTKQDPMCNGEVTFDVSIENSSKVKTSLIFFPDGRFVQQEVEIAYKSVPAKVKSSLQTSFKEATPSATVEQLTLATSDTQYLVDVVAKNKTTEVILDLGGNIICQR